MVSITYTEGGFYHIAIADKTSRSCPTCGREKASLLSNRYITTTKFSDVIDILRVEFDEPEKGN